MADLCKRIERRLECHVRSVPEARQLIAQVLDEVGFRRVDDGDAVRDNILLISTEMLANAVRACRELLAVRLEVHRTWLKVEVTDDSPAPARHRQPSLSDTHGRGVDIVARLSDAWGQTTWNGSTKTVWSRLDLVPGSALAIDCEEGI